MIQVNVEVTFPSKDSDLQFKDLDRRRLEGLVKELASIDPSLLPEGGDLIEPTASGDQPDYWRVGHIEKDYRTNALILTINVSPALESESGETVMGDALSEEEKEAFEEDWKESEGSVSVDSEPVDGPVEGSTSVAGPLGNADDES